MKKTISILFLVLILIVLSGYGLSFYRSHKKQSSVDTIAQKGEEATIKIIAVGDSLTAGYGLPLAESYPVQLEKKIKEAGYSVDIINAGISGETTAGLLERSDFILSNNPDMILITIGGNDALRSLPINQTKQNLKNIIKKFKNNVPADKIFLMQVRSPLNSGISYALSFNSMYKEIAETEGIKLIPFVETEVFLNNSLMLEDGIHPNKKGYELLIDKYILPSILKELQ